MIINVFIDDMEELDRFYADISSAAESGWDFSSRWYNPKRQEVNNPKSISTQHVIPVDLNAILCWNARILSSMFEKLGRWHLGWSHNNVALKQNLSDELPATLSLLSFYTMYFRHV